VSAQATGGATSTGSRETAGDDRPTGQLIERTVAVIMAMVVAL